jgi:heme/copper-type cytochrome/quinol oxidase subunit 1
MDRLNRGQRIAVLAALAFVVYVLGHFIIDVFFDDGFIAYAPLNSGIHWPDVWRQALQFAIWLALAGGWAFIAMRALRAQPAMSNERHEE